jgi:hypothetical protein
MTNVAIMYCKRIQDYSCIACAKCHKGMAEKNGAFASDGSPHGSPGRVSTAF